MIEPPPRLAPAGGLFTLVVRQALDTHDDRERLRLERHRRQTEADRRREAEQHVRARWIGAQRSMSFRRMRAWRRA